MRRKILSKEELRKKENKRQFTLGAILVFLLMVSTFGIAINSFDFSKEETFKFNDYLFTQEGNYYTLNLNSNYFYFLTNPNNFSKINYEDSLSINLGNLMYKPLYIDSKESIPSQQIYQNLNPYVQRTQFACIEETNCEEDLPIKTREDNIIEIKKSKKNKIYSKENCTFIEGKEEDLTALTEITILKLLGID